MHKNPRIRDSLRMYNTGMANNNHIYVGTSGWHYKHWIGPFYPPDFKPPDFLGYFCRHLKTVEINNSFYHLPHEKAVLRWAQTVPKRFVFAVKASRYITHIKRLKACRDALAVFFQRMTLLEKQLGPVLFQLPPRWGFDVQRLRRFLDILPRGFRYAFEFRDPSWFQPPVYEMLAKHNAAFCIFELNGLITPKETTADFVYVRLHGPGAAYQGCYSEDALQGWSRDFRKWQRDGKDVYCYFDNDQAGYAVCNAQQMSRTLEES